MSTPARPLLAALAALLFVASPLAQGATAPPGKLVVQDEISLAGSGELAVSGGGAVHYAAQELPSSFRLDAEQITLEYAWQSGRTAGPPGDEQFYRESFDQGRETERFTNATLTVGTFEGRPEILTYPNTGNPEIQVDGTGDLSYGSFQQPYVTGVGLAPDAASTDDSRSLSFWYEPSDDWSIGQRNDEALVEQDFSLFLNNLTVTVQDQSQTVWENWTGYQEEDVGPVASSFERHLLKVHVTNGTLHLTGEDRVTVLGSSLGIQATGVVTAATATGELEIADSVFAFDAQPLRMEGNGRLEIAEATSPDGAHLTIGVDDGSSFNVHGGQRMDTGLTGPDGLAGWSLWLSGSLVGLLVAGTVVHHTGYSEMVLQRWRSGRYAKWMTRGRELADAGNYGQAATCFQRATTAQPSEGVAWYHLAIALLEDSQPRQALDVVDQAREGEAVIDELDFLEIEAEAARWIGDADRCRAAIAQLAEGSEAMARSLAHDLELDAEVLGRELAGRLTAGRDDRGLPGYV